MRRQRELRTESINIKLTETEFALIAARATPEWSPTEVARDLLLKAVTAPDPDVVALMAELLSAREATLNALDRLAAGVLTTELMKTIVVKADHEKRQRALKRLAAED